MIEDVNPFVYSRPLNPEDVIDRDRETQELLEKAVGGHYVRLYAPRKYGKTSLLGRALRDGAAREGLISVHVDLYRVMSLGDVVVRFERAYATHLRGALRTKIESFLKRTGIGLSLGAYGIGARLQVEPRLDPVPALHALLALPLELEKSGGYRALIALDEFQDVGKIPDLDGLIRSHIQYHGNVASYVFAGSEAGMMKQLFEDRSRPLYGSAVPMRLQRLADADVAAYVVDRFEQTGRDVGDALVPLLASAQGHPKQTMLLAHRVWEEIDKGKAATLEDWERAHGAALAELDAEFDAHWRGLSTSEQKTLRAVIDGEGSPYTLAVLQRLSLSKTMVQKALPRLAARADVELENQKQRLVDPLFAEWIVRG
ncbi:MAG: AAA family ATPase [Gaiellaceae bacterium]